MILQPDHLMTLIPGHDDGCWKPGHYRWMVHAALPFASPVRGVWKWREASDGRQFEFGIENGLDQVTRHNGGLTSVRLVPQGTELPNDLPILRREAVRSVAIGIDEKQYPSPSEALKDSDQKSRTFVESVAREIGRVQRTLPYRYAWLIHPVSAFDLGIVHINIDHWCGTHSQWEAAIPADTSAISMPARLNRSPLQVDLPQQQTATPVDVANELLAEAHRSAYRGQTRLSILNSYAAVENMANAVFSICGIAFHTKHGMSETEARAHVEAERKDHRTDAKYLFHRGIHSVSGRSLFAERKQDYDDLLILQDERHHVAHGGHRPSGQQAVEAHLLCCRCAQWLADVGGFPVHPMEPKRGDLDLEGYSFDINDVGGTLQLLRAKRPANPPGGSVKNVQLNLQRVPANAPCPCGSGKKFKKCCGRGA